jgi:hypothetical protein
MTIRLKSPLPRHLFFVLVVGSFAMGAHADPILLPSLTITSSVLEPGTLLLLGTGLLTLGGAARRKFFS